MKSIYLLTSLILGLLSLSACKDKNTSETGIHYGKNHLTEHEVASIKLVLPSKPIIGDVQLPEKLKSLVTAFETYKVVNGSTQISIIHSTYNTADINLDNSADGAITQIRTLPDISSFVSTKELFSVSGLPGRKLAFNYIKAGQVMNHHVLIFIRGMELWQIQVIGRGKSSASATESLRDRVFSSVQLLD